jgi:hypothetical protein
VFAVIAGAATWYLLSMKIWGVRPGSGGPGGDEIGGPFNI